MEPNASLDELLFGPILSRNKVKRSSKDVLPSPFPLTHLLNTLKRKRSLETDYTTKPLRIRESLLLQDLNRLKNFFNGRVSLAYSLGKIHFTTNNQSHKFPMNVRR